MEQRLNKDRDIKFKYEGNKQNYISNVDLTMTVIFLFACILGTLCQPRRIQSAIFNQDTEPPSAKMVADHIHTTVQGHQKRDQTTSDSGSEPLEFRLYRQQA